jgi:hypothetical protein
VVRLLRSFALLLLVARCDGLGHSDFDCELAVGHLADCCPNFPTHAIACETTGGGCAHDHLPVLRSDESQCILRQDCSDVIRIGLCTSVPQLQNPVGYECDLGSVWWTPPCQYIDETHARPPVCP